MRSLRLLSFGLPLLLASAGFAQKSPKQSAQVWVGAHAQISFNNASSGTSYTTTWSDSTAGSTNLYNATTTVPQDSSEAPVQTANLLEQLTPGHLYLLTISSAAINSLDLQFNAPPGYTIFIGPSGSPMTPHTTIASPSYSGGSGSFTVDFYIAPNDEANFLAPGYALPPQVDDVTWAVSVGSLSNGTSAGAIRWSSSSVIQGLLDASSLNYVDPNSAEVTTYTYSDGTPMYIGTNQVQIYIRRNSGTNSGYTIEVYDPSDTFTWADDDPSQAWTFSAADTKQYTVSNPDSSWLGRVQITKLDRASGLTENYILSQSGSTTTVTETDSLRVITRSSTSGPGSGQRTETVTVADNSSHVAIQRQRIFQTFPWGEEMVSDTADPSGLALTSTYTYYSTTAGDGHYSKLQSVTQPNGSWTLYDYYDDFARWGELAAVYSPWQDSPSSYSTASSGNSQETVYSYAMQRAVFKELSAGTQTTVNGTAVAQTTISPAVATNSTYSEPVRTDTISSYANASTVQTTVRKVFNNDADPNYNGKLYSVTNPDGTKTSASHLQVDFTDDTSGGSWASTAVTPDTGGIYWCDTYLIGTASQGDSSAVEYSNDGMAGGLAIDPVWMTPNRSYRRQVVRDSGGNRVFEMTQVFTGSGFQLISWDERTFTSDTLVLTDQKNDGELTSYSYTDGKVNHETDPDGSQTEYSFDALMRITSAQKDGVGGHSSYVSQPAIVTSYTYDAAGHVLTTSTQGSTGGATLTASGVYNLAGLPTSATNAAGLTGTFAYTNGGRTVTATLPNGSTQVIDNHIDGTPASVTGTGVISQYYGCTVNSDGSITCQTNIGSSSSPRSSQTTTDWLGRTIAQTNPAFGGGNFTVQSYYNTSSQLVKTTRPGQSATLFQYDGLGQLQYTGVDVNNNGTLDLGATDRVTEIRSQVVNQSSAWWQQTTTSIFNQAGSSTPVVQSQMLKKLAPYDYVDGNYSGGTALGEVDNTDLFGNVTVQKLVADRADALVTETTTLPDSSTPQVSVMYNRLPVSLQTAQNITTTFEYDGLGRETGIVDPRLGTSQISYFTSGTGQNGQAAWSQDPAGNRTNFAYDSTDGLLSSTTDPLGNAAYFGYDHLGREIKTWGPSAIPVEYAFDSYGEKTAMRTFRDTTIDFASSSWPLSDDGGDPQNPNPGSWMSGDKTVWAYDGSTGLLTSKTDPSSAAVNYSYNANDQMTTRTWARGTTTSYSYDANTGEQLGTAYSDGTPNLTYTYDRLGQTATVEDVAGTRTFAYSSTTTELQSENLGAYLGSRILARNYDSTTTGALGRNIGFTLGTTGAPTSDGGVDYGYDSFSRLNNISVSGGPAFAYAYLANSNLISSVTDSGDNWTQTRSWASNRNLLASIQTAVSSTTVGLFQYAYDVLGRRTSKVSTGELFARYSAGGLVEDYAYDAKSELTGSTTYETTDPTNTSTPMLGRTFAYTYDPIGSRLTSSVDGTSTSYTNNALNQLTSRALPGSYSISGFAPSGATVSYNGTSVTSGQKQGDYYQVNSSASNSSAPVWTQFTIASTAGGSIVRGSFLPKTPEPYTYDADGNLLTDGLWHYDWDGENRLIAMETIGNRSGDPTAIWTSGVPRQRITFAYDYLNRRVDKTNYSWGGSAWTAVSPSGETRFIYDDWDVIADYDATGGTFGTKLRGYAWGLDLSGSPDSSRGVCELLAEISASGVINLPTYDGNGNVMGLTDHSTGVVNAAYEYSPFGETLRSTGLYAQQNPYRFSTEYADDETKLVYYGRRYYNPKTGRWLSRDPKEELGGLHLYGFVRNNPLNLRDRRGLDDDQEGYGNSYQSDSGGGSAGSDPGNGTLVEVGGNSYQVDPNGDVSVWVPNQNPSTGGQYQYVGNLNAPGDLPGGYDPTLGGDPGDNGGDNANPGIGSSSTGDNSGGGDGGNSASAGGSPGATSTGNGDSTTSTPTTGTTPAASATPSNSQNAPLNASPQTPASQLDPVSSTSDISAAASATNTAVDNAPVSQSPMTNPQYTSNPAQESADVIALEAAITATQADIRASEAAVAEDETALAKIDTDLHPTVGVALGTAFQNLSSSLNTGATVGNLAPYIAAAPLGVVAAAPAVASLGQMGTAALATSGGQNFAIIVATVFTLGAPDGADDEVEQAIEAALGDAAQLPTQMATIAKGSYDLYTEHQDSK